MSLLNTASEKAEKLGAKVGPNDRACKIVYRQVIDRDKELRIDDERACINMALDLISRSAQDVIIQIVCHRNTLQDEQVIVELRPYLNNLIYKKGDKIASTRGINGRTSEGRILLALVEFLQRHVSTAAIRDGVIPVSNPDPRYTVGQNPQEQVEELMELVERIKAINARVSLEVYACADIYAAGPLNMDNMRFSVLKLE